MVKIVLMESWFLPKKRIPYMWVNKAVWKGDKGEVIRLEKWLISAHLPKFYIQ